MSYKKSIFSVLRGISSYFSNLDDVEKYRIDTYEKLRSFVYKGDYTKYRGKVLFLEFEPLDDEVIAKKLGIGKAGVRLARRRISDDAYAVLGDSFADKIMFGSERDCSVICDSVNMLEYSLSNDDYIIKDVLTLLTNSYIGDGTSEFKLTECKNEMLLLSLFTINRLSSLTDKVDSEKLNYIIRLLNNEVKNVDDRLVALKYINSLSNTNDLCKLLSQ